MDGPVKEKVMESVTDLKNASNYQIPGQNLIFDVITAALNVY
jgi:hypothetical protein